MLEPTHDMEHAFLCVKTGGRLRPCVWRCTLRVREVDQSEVDFSEGRWSPLAVGALLTHAVITNLLHIRVHLPLKPNGFGFCCADSRRHKTYFPSPSVLDAHSIFLFCPFPLPFVQ